MTETHTKHNFDVKQFYFTVKYGSIYTIIFHHDYYVMAIHHNIMINCCSTINYYYSTLFRVVMKKIEIQGPGKYKFRKTNTHPRRIMVYYYTKFKSNLYHCICKII